MTRHQDIWKQIRSFDYTSLGFLYIACLATIALVYTVLQSSQYYLAQQEFSSIKLIQEIDQQRNQVAELKQLIALAQNRTSSKYNATVKDLVATYASAEEGRAKLRSELTSLEEPCQGRPCEKLLDSEFFTLSPKQVSKDLLNRRRSGRAHNNLLQKLFAQADSYRAALDDSFALSTSIIRSRIESKMAFDLVAFIALIVLLLLQAVYVFRPAIQRLNASLATRADFLSRISHEIRNPMNSILGMADILKGTRLNYEQQRYVDNLSRSGHALLDMLDNLIDFASLERGKLGLKPAGFDLFRSIDRCVSLISIQAHHKNLNVYLCIDPNVRSALIGDATRLEQVLNNLLNNAVKFTEHGHVTLTVDAEREDGDSVLLYFSVIDTGIGINHDIQDDIFSSFVQADSSIQRKYGGSGLGLSISGELIRMMGGELQVSSRPGQGSCFYFRILLTKNKPQAYSSPPLQPLRDSHFVLVVAPQETEANRSLFAKLHSPACLLHSGQELREWRINHPASEIHELLIDDSLGIIAMINCRNIAEAQGLSDRAVALIRSNFTKENMDLLKRNGFTRFLIKPLRPWELLQLPPQTTEELPQLPAANTPGSLLARLKERKLRVLLVDDSNDNLFLLKEVVSPIAASVHFAENGLEALEKFRKNAYDVIFMDIQMPVMDGYTAIRKMRSEEDGQAGKNPIPIYAVTAHAGLVDAQKCREAGFTDRIVKPVVRNDIYTSLSKAFALGPVDMDESGPRLPARYLDKLMPTYLKTRFEDIERLRSALEQQDFHSVAQLGHKMKGSAASYGFADVSELSRELELAAKTQDLQRCIQLSEQLHRSFTETGAEQRQNAPDPS